MRHRVGVSLAAVAVAEGVGGLRARS